MQYRPFGKLDFQVSALGFGAMRLPMKEDGEKKASNCIDCDMCEEKCPQQIPISGWMPKVHETLAANQ